MSENNNRAPGDSAQAAEVKKPTKSIPEAELFSNEAHSIEEVSQYGDETDTPALKKKKPANTQTPRHTGKDTSFSAKYFRKPLSFFERLARPNQRGGRTIVIFGHEITFLPFIIAVIAVALIGMIVLNNNSIQINEQTVTIVGLPADLENYKILVISDLNGTRYGDEQSALLRRINSTSYDCVFLLGDMVGSDGDPQPLYELLEGIGTRKDIYFICGDSDPGPYVPSARAITGTLEEMLLEDWILGAIERGATYVDSPIYIEVEDSGFWISPSSLLNVNAPKNLTRFENQVEQETDGVLAGLAGDYASIPYTSYRLQLAKELSAAVSSMNATDVHITLAHEVPSDDLIRASCLHDSAGKTYLTEANLILAGHYCGGVMRLPFLGAFYIDAPSTERYGWLPDQSRVSGLSTVAESQVYITNGLSTNSDVPLMFFRLLNQPEIDVLTLTATLPDSLK